MVDNQGRRTQGLDVLVDVANKSGYVLAAVFIARRVGVSQPLKRGGIIEQCMARQMK